MKINSFPGDLTEISAEKRSAAAHLEAKRWSVWAPQGLDTLHTSTVEDSGPYQTPQHTWEWGSVCYSSLRLVPLTQGPVRMHEASLLWVSPSRWRWVGQQTRSPIRFSARWRAFSQTRRTSWSCRSWRWCRWCLRQWCVVNPTYWLGHPENYLFVSSKLYTSRIKVP